MNKFNLMEKITKYLLINTLRLVSEPLEHRTAVLGEMLTFVFVSTGTFPPPKLMLKLSGRDLHEKFSQKHVEKILIIGM
jgi:hypothetical protein